MTQATYLATEFAGDPPAAIARWYKIQSGTYARVHDAEVEFFTAAALKIELSIGRTIEFVAGEERTDEIALVNERWESG